MKTIYNNSAKLVFLPFLDISPLYSFPKTVCTSIFIFILPKTPILWLSCKYQKLLQVVQNRHSHGKNTIVNITISVLWLDLDNNHRCFMLAKPLQYSYCHRTAWHEVKFLFTCSWCVSEESSPSLLLESSRSWAFLRFWVCWSRLTATSFLFASFNWLSWQNIIQDVIQDITRLETLLKQLHTEWCKMEPYHVLLVRLVLSHSSCRGYTNSNRHQHGSSVATCKS